MVGHEVHGADDEFEHRLRYEVVEVDSHPTGLDALATAGDLPFVFEAGLDVDAEKSVAVGTGARASSPALDPEEVVEQRHHEVVVEAALAVADHEGDDREPIGVRVAENLDVRIGRPRFDGSADERLLPLPDGIDSNAFLEGEDEPRPDGPDDARCTALLAMLDVVQVAVGVGVDVGDGAAPGDGGHPIGEQLSPGHEQPGGAGSTDHLVGADERRVLVGQRIGRIDRGHGDSDVRGGRGCVPERKRPVAVQQRGHRRGVGRDAGHVGGCGERPDLERPIGVGSQRLLQCGEIDVAVRILGDNDHVGDRLTPGELVAVVLERPDEDDRSLARRDVAAQPVTVIEVLGDSHPEHPRHQVDGTC